METVKEFFDKKSYRDSLCEFDGVNPGDGSKFYSAKDQIVELSRRIDVMRKVIEFLLERPDEAPAPFSLVKSEKTPSKKKRKEKDQP